MQRVLLAPQQRHQEQAGRGGAAAAHTGAPAPRPPQCSVPVPTRTYLGGTRGRIRGAAAAAAVARRGERRRRGAASGSPGCNGRAGAARTRVPRWCRCPGREGDAAAGDSGRLFGSVRKVTAATRPTLSPPPRRTRGRGKEEEEGGDGGGGSEPFISQRGTKSQQHLSGCRSGMQGWARQCSPGSRNAGLGPRSAPLPSPWILAFTRRTTGPASERRNFPVSCGADADFWLIRLVMAGLASRYLFNHLLFGGRGIKS